MPVLNTRKQMNTILRNFFYALALVILWAMYSMNVETAQFKDVLVLLHSSDFWQTTGITTVILITLQLFMVGGLSARSDIKCSVGTRDPSSSHFEKISQKQ